MIPHHLLVQHHHDTLEAIHRASRASLDIFAGLTDIVLDAGRQMLAAQAAANSASGAKDFPAGATRDPDLRAYGSAMHIMTRGYIDLVTIAEAYWHSNQRHLQRQLAYFEQHAPGGSELLFDAAIDGSRTLAEAGDDIAEASIAAAHLAEDALAGSEPKRSRSRRT